MLWFVTVKVTWLPEIMLVYPIFEQLDELNIKSDPKVIIICEIRWDCVAEVKFVIVRSVSEEN